LEISAICATGLEQWRESSGKTDEPQECGAVGGDSKPLKNLDPELLAVIQAWPMLSAEIQRVVLTIVADAGD